jgi:hypothetical protein
MALRRGLRQGPSDHRPAHGVGRTPRNLVACGFCGAGGTRANTETAVRNAGGALRRSRSSPPARARTLRSVEPHLKRWWFVVADGWCWSEPRGFAGSSAALSCCSVVAAFGGDVCGAVLGAGASPFGHHYAAVTAAQVRMCRIGRGQVTGACAQAGKQQGAARGGDVGLCRR